MKIYTKTGDKGTTGIFGGARVSKSGDRISAIGAVDELNAHLGAVLSLCDHAPRAECFLHVRLLSVQHELFVLGALLAGATMHLSEKSILRLEVEINEMEKQLPKLRNFILPGGSRQGSLLHVSRTVARRAERSVVRLHQVEAVEGVILQYLNRLGDFLFVLARFVNHQANAPETIWQAGNSQYHLSPEK